MRYSMKQLTVLLAALAVGSATARIVTVASCDRSTGETVLSISAAEAGDGKKALVATWSPGDIGNMATNARETAYVGAVAAFDPALLTKTTTAKLTLFAMRRQPSFPSMTAFATQS